MSTDQSSASFTKGPDGKRSVRLSGTFWIGRGGLQAEIVGPIEIRFTGNVSAQEMREGVAFAMGKVRDKLLVVIPS